MRELRNCLRGEPRRVTFISGFGVDDLRAVSGRRFAISELGELMEIYI